MSAILTYLPRGGATPTRPPRCLRERGFALLTQRWHTLQHITASPSKIGGIARTALVFTHFKHGTSHEIR